MSADPGELAPRVHAAPGALRLQFSRGSGPGGQNVNKLNTKAELWVKISQIVGMTPDAMDRLRVLAGSRLTDEDELHLSAEGSRSQESNRRDVLERLRELIIAAQVRPKKRRKTRPTAGSKRRRLESKRHRSEIKTQRRGD